MKRLYFFILLYSTGISAMETEKDLTLSDQTKQKRHSSSDFDEDDNWQLTEEERKTIRKLEKRNNKQHLISENVFYPILLLQKSVKKIFK